ncbi:MAG TPA: hypothetical protein VH601_17100 [Bryobacteraceae bacterium]|jgi:hypothetical protein
MTSRELRKQRREAERKARKLAYQESRHQSSAAMPEVTSIPNSESVDEFTVEEQEEMMALRARVHARAGLSSSSESTLAPEFKPGPTGPRTPEGKTISSGNSLKHGLASGRLIIPGEDPAEFEALLNDLIAEHAPATQTEALLVQQMAQSWWLTQRAIRFQGQAFTQSRAVELAVFSEAKTREIDTQKLALFLRYQTTHERAFYKALNTLTKSKLSRARGCPQGQAVSSRRQSDPEFVSHKHPQTSCTPEFVSKRPSQTNAKPEFVSQYRPVGQTIGVRGLPPS